jgi:hypothetical protein
MVLLNVKKSDQECFLFETTVEASVKDTIRDVTHIHNVRMRIHRLKIEGEELAKYGPAKLPDKQVGRWLRCGPHVALKPRQLSYVALQAA